MPRVPRWTLALAPIATLLGCRTAPAAGTAIGQTPTREAAARRLADIRPGEERELGEGVFLKMHRIQAVEPLGDGWHRARSTEGSFSVELPLPFNDFWMRAQTTDHVELRTHVVGAKTPGLLAWTATCMVRRDGKRGPDNRARAPDRIEARGTPPAAYQRSVDFDDMTCFLIVEAQGADPLPSEVDRNRFLRSLRREGAPVW